jgi:hypothetical protein
VCCSCVPVCRCAVQHIPLAALRDGLYTLHRNVIPARMAAIGAVTVFGVDTYTEEGTRIIDRGALVFRKDGYGVRVLDGTMLTALVKHEGLIVWELRGDTVSGFTDASILNLIRTRIVELQCGVVVVRDLRRVSAVLFKWLAEFTKSNPWCYIFFDSLDITLLLLEDLNRYAASCWQLLGFPAVAPAAPVSPAVVGVGVLSCAPSTTSLLHSAPRLGVSCLVFVQAAAASHDC